MDKHRVTAIGVPVRRFLVSRGVIQITRISDERTQAKIKDTFCSGLGVQERKDNKVKKSFLRVDISVSFAA